MQTIDETVTDSTAAIPAATTPEPTKEGRLYTKAEIEAIVKDRLERQKKAVDANTAKIAEEARLRALVESGDYKKLADEREAALYAAQKQLAEMERYQTALSAQLEREKAGLPQYVLDLLADKSVVDQLEYLAKHGKALRMTAEPAAPNLNGASKSAKPVVDPKARAEELQRRFPSLKINK
jgi:hypothetical protein